MNPPKAHPPINDNGPDEPELAEGEDKAPSAYRTISEVSTLLDVPFTHASSVPADLCASQRKMKGRDATTEVRFDVE